MAPSEALMDRADADQLQFRGQDATELKCFIAALLKLAFAQGKQRDDHWLAEVAATCMVDDALVWWGELDEEVQGSWRLLRQAMRLEYCTIFYGGSGEEVEKFIRIVREKAIEEGKRKDNEWIITYVESCLAGEALRWHAHLDSDTKGNWTKLQQALLIQYPRNGSCGQTLSVVPTPPAAASLAPAATVTRRGRIRITNSSNSIPHYLSKQLASGNRIASTSSIADALELEWSTGSDGMQTLAIPRASCDSPSMLAASFDLDILLSHKYRVTIYSESSGVVSIHKSRAGFCAVDSRTNSTSLDSSFYGSLLTKDWKISPKDGRSDGILVVSVKAGKETLCPKWNTPANVVWFSEDKYWTKYPAEFFFESM